MVNERKNLPSTGGKSEQGGVGRNGRGNKSARLDSGVQFKGFVNYTPVEADRKPFGDYLQSADALSSDLATTVEAGYKLSLSYDQRSDCFVATLYANSLVLPQPGYCLSQRSSDWYKALAKALYVHIKVFETVWPTDGGGSWVDPLE